MASSSKEIAAEDSPRKKKQKVVGTILKDLPDEVFLVVSSFVDFFTLCRVKPVCKWWMDSIDRGIDARLGKNPFMSEEVQPPVQVYEIPYNRALRNAVKEYCFCKGREISQAFDFFPIKSKSEYAEKLASTYGWPIGKWDVSQVTNFSYIFAEMTTFNEDIGNWNVSNATAFNGMFCSAASFNQDLSSWNTANVVFMNCMFKGATSFNQDLSPWNIAKVIFINGMFEGATSFNQDISSWDLTGFKDHEDMFVGATSFNHEFAPQFSEIATNNEDTDSFDEDL